MGPVLKMGKGRKEKRRQELKSEKREKQQQDQTVFRKRNSNGEYESMFPQRQGPDHSPVDINK